VAASIKISLIFGAGNPAMDEDRWYFQIGGCLGLLVALVTFVGGWWYCASEYGFLFGFGLGWLPSAILAAMAYLSVKVLWGLVLGLVFFFVVIPALRDTNAETSLPISKTISSDWNDTDYDGDVEKGEEYHAPP
jgi:hypothetical protein